MTGYDGVCLESGPWDCELSFQSKAAFDACIGVFPATVSKHRPTRPMEGLAEPCPVILYLSRCCKRFGVETDRFGNEHRDVGGMELYERRY